eukprot:m.64959 g.64959  ORF g.64959 m.64959 type:complete len:61 (-) comp9734_c0_seq3:1989-2171(-)
MTMRYVNLHFRLPLSPTRAVLPSLKTYGVDAFKATRCFVALSSAAHPFRLEPRLVFETHS